ncbi:hypothetical protein [Azospirillum sp. sgz301742]
MRDLVHNLGVVNAIPPQTITTTPVSSAVLDLLGFNSVAVFVAAGTITDGSYAVTLTAGDKADGSDQADATADVLGSLPTFAATDDNTAKKFGYAGPHRYLVVTITPTGATSGGLFSAEMAKGHPAAVPVA